MEPLRPGDGLYVVTSELRATPDGGADTLLAAFRDRVHLVDGYAGHDRLEVWRDLRDADRFVMTSWWESKDAFVAYMRSEEHRLSHARVPHEAVRPVAVSRYDVVAR
jgi:heme-degrading monooxygenase HmoA